jgi:formate hydrogenlyase subunit 3/multisubunit Na+/H+ antiporter MnhD subunit
MVTLILAAIPMLIVGVGLWQIVAKLIDKKWAEMSVFAVVTVVAVAFWYFAYWRKKEHRKLLEERGFHTVGPAETLKKLGLLIGGAVLTLGVVGAGIFGGWQLIQGSLFWGGIFAGVGLVFGVLCHKPEAEWNPCKKWYSALVEGNSDGADEQSEAHTS